MTGHIPFDPDHKRTYEEVLAAYERSDDIYEWLREEIGVFLDGDTFDETTEERIDAMLDTLEDRADDLQLNVMRPDEVLGVEARIYGDGEQHVVLLRDSPHPVELMMIVAYYAEPGDLVQISHHYVDSVYSVGRTWPFSVDDAVLLTSPDPRSRSDGEVHDDGDLDGPARVPLTPPAVTAAVFAATCTVIGVAAGMWLNRRR